MVGVESNYIPITNSSKFSHFPDCLLRSYRRLVEFWLCISNTNPKPDCHPITLFLGPFVHTSTIHAAIKPIISHSSVGRPIRSSWVSTTSGGYVKQHRFTLKRSINLSLRLLHIWKIKSENIATKSPFKDGNIPSWKSQSTTPIPQTNALGSVPIGFVAIRFSCVVSKYITEFPLDHYFCYTSAIYFVVAG